MSEDVALSAYLSARRKLVDSWIEAQAWEAEPSGVADDLDRFLYGPLARYNEGAGKRLRPILCMLGCEACGGEALAALAVGCAIESFQSAALIHDDIADGGQMRRGEPCLHISEGLGPAINIGDAALVQAADIIVSQGHLDARTRLELIEQLVAMERMTLEGQALDLGWVRDGRWDLTQDDYLYMASLKTASYSVATPLMMGAICAGAGDAEVGALGEYGQAAGLAFQIADDLLNLTGDADALGKDFRSDISEGKRTFAVCWALENFGAAERDELVGILSSHAEDGERLARAVGLLEAGGALDAARQAANSYVRAALRSLDSVELVGEEARRLESMAHFFVERAS